MQVKPNHATSFEKTAQQKKKNPKKNGKKYNEK
jgi:hypothetical protein